MTYGLPASAAARPVVWVAVAEAGGVYGEVTAALRDELERRRRADIDWRIGTWGELAQAGGSPELVVTVGAGAWREAAVRLADLRDPPALIATLLPAAAFERDRPRHGRARVMSAVLLDQPAGRLARTIQGVVRHARRVSMLTSGDDIGGDELSVALASLGIELDIVVTDPQRMSRDLIRAMSGYDALVLRPDARIINRQTVGNLVAASYRLQVPLIGFSPNLVSAGALAGLFITPAQTGRVAAALAADALDGKPLPPPRPAALFEIGINASVARAFGLDADVAAITAAVQSAEAGANR